MPSVCRDIWQVSAPFRSRQAHVPAHQSRPPGTPMSPGYCARQPRLSPIAQTHSFDGGSATNGLDPGAGGMPPGALSNVSRRTSGGRLCALTKHARGITRRHAPCAQRVDPPQGHDGFGSGRAACGRPVRVRSGAVCGVGLRIACSVPQRRRLRWVPARWIRL